MLRRHAPRCGVNAMFTEGHGTARCRMRSLEETKTPHHGSCRQLPILDFILHPSSFILSPLFVFALVLLLGAAAGADSLFGQAPPSGTLVSKQKDFEPGDIVTVTVEETIKSSVRSITNTKKESDVESQAAAAQNQFIVSENGMDIVPSQKLPNWNIGIKNEHKARGQTDRTSSLTTSIACVITRVHPNGLLAIEGDKIVATNREDCHIHVSGLVRAKDISAANTISSTQIANAVIKLTGKGPLWNSQRRGLVTKFLDWFSPF